MYQATALDFAAPMTIQTSIKMLRNKFTSFYAGKVQEKLANGEQEVFILFAASEMKPLHAEWTADSLLFVRATALDGERF